MRKMQKRIWEIAIFASLVIFAILLVSMILNALFALLLFEFGILDFARPVRSLMVFAVLSAVVGLVLARYLGGKPVRTLVAISEATKEVAQGNFDVRLNEDIRINEIREIAQNFNSMASDLASTEMMRKDFIENVSHEFKTPLAAIEGYVTLLQNKNLSEEKRELYTKKILQSTRRLSSLSGNILMLSQVENQQREIKTEWFSLDEQLRESVLILEPQWSAKNIELDIELQSVDYCGNVAFLAQVWQNLIGNAIKFAPKKGFVRVALMQEKNKVCVCVEDNGAGMTQEVADRIFEKFYQGDQSHSAQGNGLGLPLAKRIVDLHGGSITVTSVPGQGTVFKVELPA